MVPNGRATEPRSTIPPSRDGLHQTIIAGLYRLAFSVLTRLAI